MGEESPKNKVKFLCSYGGKVLPRPSDGVLKYVGGETRVICVPRDVTFSEIMKKVSGMVEGEVVLKYQMVPEDLDALVSVRTDEDLKHMIEEHNRHESAGTPLLRAFLFPSKPLVVDTQAHGQQPQPPPFEPAYLVEQRYIDAINGIIRTSPRARVTSCSACSSPKSNSPDAQTTADSPFHPSQSQSQSQSHSHSHPGLLPMHKVRSSPSLTNLSISTPQPPHDHPHHHHPLPYPSPSPSASPSTSRHAQDPQMGMGMGMGRPPPVMTEFSSRSPGVVGLNYYYSNTRPHKGYVYHDDSAAYGGHVVFERVHSVPRSRSPRKSIWE